MRETMNNKIIKTTDKDKFADMVHFYESQGIEIEYYTKTKIFKGKPEKTYIIIIHDKLHL
jgi:hypothetical protein